MQMNHKVNGQFQKLYPVTLGDNVKLNSGTTLEGWKAYIEDRLNTYDTGQVELWTGNHIMGITGSGITLSKSINNSRNGWILVFKPSNTNNNYNYCYVPKVHPPGIGIKFIIGGTLGSVYSKYITVNGNRLEGHSANNQNGNEIMELIRVIEH